MKLLLDNAKSAGTQGNVVFLLQASGSMGVSEGSAGPPIDMAKEKMIRSIVSLDRSQSFHLISFGEDQAQKNDVKQWKDGIMENPPPNLVEAAAENKIAATKFMEPIRCGNKDQVIPALKRAFEVLAPAKSPKTVVLFTNGNFQPTSEVSSPSQISAMLRELNADGKVAVDVVLFPLDDESSKDEIAAMKKIASENGGKLTTEKIEKIKKPDPVTALNTLSGLTCCGRRKISLAAEPQSSRGRTMQPPPSPRRRAQRCRRRLPGGSGLTLARTAGRRLQTPQP